jgi:hypothetical protein
MVVRLRSVGNPSPSAQSLEPPGSVDDSHRELPEFGCPCPVVRGGDDILGRAPKLEQPVLQVRDLGRGQEDGILGEPPSLHRRTPLVGALPAWLATIAAWPTDLTVVG